MRVAVHEAAHAVAVFLHRGTIDCISAEAMRGSGYVAWRHGAGCDVCDPVTAAVVALSGTAGEGPYLGIGDRVDALTEASPDADKVDAAIGAIAHSPQEAVALAAWLRVRTQDFVRTTKFARLMQELLPLLLEHGELDGDTATAALQRAELAFENELRTVPAVAA